MLKMTEYEELLFSLGGPQLGELLLMAHRSTISPVRPPEIPPSLETIWSPVEQLSLFTDEELQMCLKECSDQH
jgi:hypothetical protein